MSHDTIYISALVEKRTLFFTENFHLMLPVDRVADNGRSFTPIGSGLLVAAAMYAPTALQTDCQCTCLPEHLLCAAHIESCSGSKTAAMLHASVFVDGSLCIAAVDSEFHVIIWVVQFHASQLAINSRLRPCLCEQSSFPVGCRRL